MTTATADFSKRLDQTADDTEALLAKLLSDTLLPDEIARPKRLMDAMRYSSLGGGKRFYVRDLENGAAAWLILPDRQVRLDKMTGAGTRYSNGIAVLEINGNEATLNDAPSISNLAFPR